MTGLTHIIVMTGYWQDRSWGKEFKLLMHAGDQAEAMYHIVTSSLFTCIRYGDAAVSEMMLPVLGEATEAVKLSLKALMVYALLLF